MRFHPSLLSPGMCIYVVPYDVALRIDINDDYESTLFASWGYDATDFDVILMGVIRGPQHLDKRTKDAGTIIVSVMILT